jgi:hypothetical protein
LEDNTYGPFVKAFLKPDPTKGMRKLYIPKWWHKVLYPFAARYFHLNIWDPRE